MVVQLWMDFKGLWLLTTFIGPDTDAGVAEHYDRIMGKVVDEAGNLVLASIGFHIPKGKLRHHKGENDGLRIRFDQFVAKVPEGQKRRFTIRTMAKNPRKGGVGLTTPGRLELFLGDNDPAVNARYDQKPVTDLDALEADAPVWS